MSTQIKTSKATPKKTINTDENPAPATSHWGGLWIIGVAVLLVIAIGVYQWWQQKPRPVVEVGVEIAPIAGLILAREEVIEELKKIVNQLPQAIVLPPLEELSEGLFKRDLNALNKIEEIIRSLPESSEVRLALMELFCRFVPENSLCISADKMLFPAEELFLAKSLDNWSDRVKIFACIDGKTAYSQYVSGIIRAIQQDSRVLSMENVLREIASDSKNFIRFRGIGPKAVWGITNTLKQIAPNFYKEIWEPSFREWMQNPLDRVQKYSDTPILECWK